MSTDISKCDVKPYHFSDGGSDSCFVMFDRETTGACASSFCVGNEIH